MKKVIVTGAGGLLGRHVVPCLAEHCEVWAAGRKPPPFDMAGVHSLAIDLSAPLEGSSLPQQVDSVVYLAQSNRFREFPEAVEDVFHVNTAQVVAMLDYARRAGARNFVFASTGGVYGTGDKPFAEAHAVPPRGASLPFYPASKLAAEILARAFESCMNIVILRFFFIYGRGQKREMLIPRLIDNVTAGRPISLQGPNGLRLNPIAASDAAEAVAAAEALGESATINVAGPEVLSIREISETIGDLVGRDPIFQIQADQLPGHVVADISNMRRLLMTPRRRFADAVSELL